MASPVRSLRRLRGGVRLGTAALRPHAPERVVLSVCVDGDENRVAGAATVGVSALERIHARLGLGGAVTWFINQRYRWTERQPELLRRLLESGDRLELHGHAEKLIAAGEGAALREFLADQLSSLTTFCRQVQPGYQVECFRSGSLERSPELYQVLEELGIRYDSTLAPGYRRKVYGRMVDDTDLPANRNCYYLEARDYKRPQPKPCQIVEIPLMLAEVRPVRAVLKGPDQPVVLATLVHPYALMGGRGRLNWRAALSYELMLRALLRIAGGRALTLRAAGEKWREAHPGPVASGQWSVARAMGRSR